MVFQLDNNIYSKQKSFQDFQAEDQQAQMNDYKLREAKLSNASKYLAMATPQNWNQIRTQAINEGLGDESTIPQNYDEGWVSRTRQAFADTKSTLPSSVQEYNLYKTLSPQDQVDYLNVKRANNPLNLGDYFGIRNPVTNEVAPLPGGSINPKPDNAPALRGQQAEATAKGRVVGEASASKEVKSIQAPQILETVQRAEKILPEATSGLYGKAQTGLANMLGISTDKSKADKQLKVLASSLTASVPRMEGPQSNIDVELYKQAAGDIANSAVPFEDRLAALQTIKQINEKYSQQPTLNSPIDTGAPVIDFEDNGDLTEAVVEQPIDAKRARLEELRRKRAGN